MLRRVGGRGVDGRSMNDRQVAQTCCNTVVQKSIWLPRTDNAIHEDSPTDEASQSEHHLACFFWSNDLERRYTILQERVLSFLGFHT